MSAMIDTKSSRESSKCNNSYHKFVVTLNSAEMKKISDRKRRKSRKRIEKSKRNLSDTVNTSRIMMQNEQDT